MHMYVHSNAKAQENSQGMKQYKCPTPDEQIKKMYSMCTVKYYVAEGKEKPCSHLVRTGGYYVIQNKSEERLI